MPRKNFSRRTIADRFKAAGGRCEALRNGKRCNALLKPGVFECHHENPDGLTGEPTFENARIFCKPCHAEQTKVDRKNIAQAQRREQTALGIKRPGRQEIQSKPMSSREKREPKPSLPPRRLYVDE